MVEALHGNENKPCHNSFKRTLRERYCEFLIAGGVLAAIAQHFG